MKLNESQTVEIVDAEIDGIETNVVRLKRKDKRKQNSLCIRAF